LEAAMLSNLMEEKYGDRIDRPRAYRQTVVDSVDESLSRLGTDYLDILMCPHGASSPEELMHDEIFEAFELLKKAGKVRHLGVSSHSDPAGVLKAAVESGKYSVAMVAYNVANESFMNGPLAEAKTADVGVIAMKVARTVYPGDGRREPDPKRIEKLAAIIDGPWSVPQKAYLWGLSNDNLSAVISNITNDHQLEENLKLPAVRDQIG
jgi:aryl-alcohol dehydrogenase-like predicted oxidoreductase